MIVNKVSKVYGPSIKNICEAGADLGLVNLETLGFEAFLERNKRAMVKIIID